MKKQQLTELEHNRLKLIEPYDGLFIRMHKQINGTRCYRIVDHRITPKCNIERKVFESLSKKGYVKIEGEIRGGSAILKILN